MSYFDDLGATKTKGGKPVTREHRGKGLPAAVEPAPAKKKKAPTLLGMPRRLVVIVGIAGLAGFMVWKKKKGKKAAAPAVAIPVVP